MKINPFSETPLTVSEQYYNWKQLSTNPYDFFNVDPYTKARIILANAVELDSMNLSWAIHQHTDDNDVRRTLAVLRRSEAQQQKRIASLKPLQETVMEHAIGYEQLAVDLTAHFAQKESDKYVKASYDFALIEDFDHLYRFANYLDETGKKANLVGSYTELMPGRPTISHHRYPTDEVKRFANFRKSNNLTKLDINLIVAAERQTMNYYMNNIAFTPDKMAKDLLIEIGMVEEEHVTMYGSLKDVKTTWLEELLLHEYTECYLYYSLMEEETDKRIRNIWEEHFNAELTHLHTASNMLEKYEGKVWQQVISEPVFPSPLKLASNIDYVRNVLRNQITLTANREEFVDVDALPPDAKFFDYQETVNKNLRDVASHNVIVKHIVDCEKDYRFETMQHPVDELRNRSQDNTTVGR